MPIPDWFTRFPSALDTKLGLEVTELTPERIVGRMPVEGNTQPVGLFHGGGYVVLGESLGSMHANFLAGPGRLAVGVDINATHPRSATSGIVTGVATAIHLGRSTTSYDVAITDEQGRRVCTARITCALLVAPAP